MLKVAVAFVPEVVEGNSLPITMGVPPRSVTGISPVIVVPFIEILFAVFHTPLYQY